MRALAFFAVLALTLSACTTERAVSVRQSVQGAAQVAAADQQPDPQPASSDAYDPTTDSLRFAGEVHLRNLRQLTYGGNNAEAYWSYDGEQLIFQSDWQAINGQGCDQQFVMNADGSDLSTGERYRLVSTGQGRTTCGYFLADGRVIYSSTHAADLACPTTAASETGRYVWDIFPTFDIYVANADGTGTELLIGGEGYDAEPTVSPDGRFVIFTSTRSGDLELYRYELATGETIQLTDELGYDGGAFFSPDGSQIVWRASRPTGEAAETYRRLLADDMVQPGALDIYVANADGTDKRRVTRLPGANWAPFFHPSGEKILFSSNHHTMAEGGREFDLFLIDIESGEMDRVTHSGTFDAFPMFSPDGTKLVFASNRRTDRAPSRDTNIFVADWVDEPEAADLEFETIQP